MYTHIRIHFNNWNNRLTKHRRRLQNGKKVWWNRKWWWRHINTMSPYSFRIWMRGIFWRSIHCLADDGWETDVSFSIKLSRVKLSHFAKIVGLPLWIFFFSKTIRYGPFTFMHSKHQNGFGIFTVGNQLSWFSMSFFVCLIKMFESTFTQLKVNWVKSRNVTKTYYKRK